MCPSCSGRMKILTALIKPGSVRVYLDGVGLPSRAPPIAPSGLDRQLEFAEVACSLRRVSADTPVPTRHAIAATRPLQHVVGMILPSPRAIDWRRASHSACLAGTRLTIMAPYRAYSADANLSATASCDSFYLVPPAEGFKVRPKESSACGRANCT